MLKKRIVTALVLIFLFGAFTVLLPPFWYALLIGAVILAAAREWSVLTGMNSMAGRLVYLCLLIVAGALLFAWLGVTPAAVALNRTETALLLGIGLAFWLLVPLLLLGYPDNRVRWDSGPRIGAMGALALLPSLMGVIYLKYLEPAGYLVLALVAAVAAVDIGAFFYGRGFGRKPLAPAISPNKTWEGVWGGLAVCLLAAAAMAWAMHRWLRPLNSGDSALIAALALATIAFGVIGDLLESMLKRNRNAKDSGNLLPGHGGLCDRVDSLLAATPVFVLGMMVLVQGNNNQ